MRIPVPLILVFTVLNIMATANFGGDVLAQGLSSQVLSSSHCRLEPRSLTFGVYSSNRPSAVYKQFRPILNALEVGLAEQTGREYKVALKIFKTYKAGRRALVDGKVDFARFGSASYVIAEREDPGLRLLAMELKKGKKSFLGFIVVKKDSPIRSLRELKGRTFAFGDKTSTIGRYLSQAELLDANISGKHLLSYRFLGRHDLVFKSVALGDEDAGALNEPTFNKLNKKNQLRVIHSFSCVTKPWLARSSLDQKTAEVLSRVLCGLKEEKVLKALKASGIARAESKDYDKIRRSMALAAKFATKK